MRQGVLQEAQVAEGMAKSLGQPGRPLSSSLNPLELGVDVVNCVPDRAQVLEVLVVDAETDRALPQLLFQGFDQLDQGQGVGVEVLDEGGALGDRRRVGLQDVGQLVPDQLEHPFAVEGALIGVGFRWHGTSVGVRRQQAPVYAV